jgi:receptor protein-tyrosine kinase
VDLKQFVQVTRRRWLTIVALLVVALAASAAYSFLSTPQYDSTSKVFITADSRTASDSYVASLFAAGRMQSYADLATSTDLMELVIDDLGLNLNAAQLASKISASVIPDTLRISISTTDPDPRVAQAITRSTADQLTDYLADLETPAGAASSQISARVTDPATLGTSPVSPRTKLNLAVAGLLGLILGLALAIARDVLDRRISSLDHVHEVTRSPVLSSIGFDPSVKKSPLLTDVGGFAPRTEAFRLLRTNLQFLDLDSQPRSLVITSAVPGEGKTTTATNLAVALAQAGRRVLLVDGDLRRPRIAGLLGLDGAVGITTVLIGSADVADAIQVHEPTGLHFLASGAKPPNPTEILQSRLTADLIHGLQDTYDMVIIDAPPLLPVADAAVLATITDGSIIVTRHGKTTREQLREAITRLEQVNGRLFGIVMNMIPRRSAKSYYYYYYEEVTPNPGRKNPAKSRQR